MKQNTTYKQTELGLIPDDWEVKKLGEIGNIITGSTPSTTNLEYYKNGTFDFIGPADLNSNKYIDNAEKKVTEKGLNVGRILKQKSVLVTCIGSTIGKIGINKNICITNQQINAIETDKNNSDFIYYSILERKGRLKLIAGEQAVPVLNKTEFSKFKIPLPPLPEQKKIADCLSTWDVAIEKQNALINVLTDRKKALMQQLLTGKKRLPGFSGEWKEVKLGDLFEKINRKNEEGNTNVVTISAQRGFVKQTDFFNKSVASETLDNYSLIYHGEFCYNKSYSNGYPLGATKRLIAFEKAVVTTLYICFKIKDQKKSNGSFFEQFFEANSLDRSLIKIAQEGGRAHGLLNVSLSDFFNIKIKLPPIEEQTAIAEILAAADRELQLQKEKLAQLQAQKKGLMQVLLTGKKRLIN